MDDTTLALIVKQTFLAFILFITCYQVYNIFHGKIWRWPGRGSMSPSYRWFAYKENEPMEFWFNLGISIFVLVLGLSVYLLKM